MFGQIMGLAVWSPQSQVNQFSTEGSSYRTRRSVETRKKPT